MMNKSMLFALLVVGGVVLLAHSASAATVRPRPTPIIAPINDPTPQPIVSAN